MIVDEKKICRNFKESEHDIQSACYGWFLKQSFQSFADTISRINLQNCNKQ